MGEEYYSKLIKHMRTQGAKYNPQVIEIGQVLNSNPLTIKVQDLSLGPDSLLVPAELKQGYSKVFEVDGIEKTFIVKNELNPGDVVALYQISNTTFIIIGKYERP